MSSAIPGLIYFNDGVFVLFFFLFLSLFFSQDTFYQQVMAIVEERKRQRRFGEFIFQKIIFQTFLCLFAIKKVGQWRTFSSQRKTFFSQRKI